MPLIPKYNQQVSPDVANQPEVPKIDLSGGLSSTRNMYESDQGLSDKIGDIGNLLAKHAAEQQELKNDQIDSQIYTQASRDLQDKLFNTETETVKINGQDINREKGILNRKLGFSEGSTSELDNYYFGGAREGWLNQIKDQRHRAKVESMIDNHYNGIRNSVIEHEVKQTKQNDLNIKETALNQIKSDSFLSVTKDSLRSSLINGGIAFDDLSRSKGLDKETSDREKIKVLKDITKTSVVGALTIDPSGNKSIELLDSLRNDEGRYLLGEENYSELKDVITKNVINNQKLEIQAKKLSEAKYLEEIDGKIIDGNMNVVDLEEYRGKISDKEYLAKKNYLLSSKSVNPEVKATIFNNLQDEFISLHINKDDSTDASIDRIANFRANVLDAMGKGHITQDDGQRFLREVSVAFDNKTKDEIRKKYHWWQTLGDWAERNSSNISDAKMRMTQEFKDKAESNSNHEEIVKDIIFKEYIKNNPEDIGNNRDNILDKSKNKEISFKPAIGVLERIGKGFGRGVAGSVEGFGGALKWIGAKDVGKIVSNHAKRMENFYDVPDKKFIDQVYAGFGSLGTFFIPGLGISKGVQIATAMPRLASWIGVSASTALEATVEAGSSYERAIEKNWTNKEASDAASKTFWLNIPTIAITNKLGLFGDKGNLFVKSLKSAGFEGFQEFTQSIISNISLKDPAFNGAFESAAVGFITGGGGKLIISGAEGIDNLKEAKDIKDNFEPPKDDNNGNIVDNPKPEGPLPTYEGIDLTKTQIERIGLKEGQEPILNKESIEPITVEDFYKSNKAISNNVFMQPKYFDNGKPGIGGLEQPSKDRKLLQDENRKSIVYRDDNGNPQGSITFFTTNGKLETREDYGASIEVYVNPEFRRQGIATKLYDKAKSLGFDLDTVDSRSFTIDGASLNYARLKNKEKGISLSSESGKILIPDLPKLSPEVRKDIGAFSDSSLVPLSTRLAKIDERLRDVMRKFEFNRGLNTHNDIQKALPFMKKMELISQDDLSSLDLALKNIDLDTINDVVDRNNIRKEYEDVRNLLDELYNKAKEVGVDVKYIDDYFPRRVENPEKFMDYLRQSDKWSAIDEAIKKEEISVGHRLETDERVEFINKMIRGYGKEQLRVTSPSNTKNRKIKIIDENMNSFYKSSSVTLQEYIVAMNNLIESKKFFGINGKDIDKSIGAYVNDLVENEIITHEQEAEVRSIVDARFKERGTHGIWSFYKNLGYIYTMGSPLSAITQIGDIGFSLYENGFYNTSQGLKSSFSKNKITKQDLGLDIIIDEFSDRGKSGVAVKNIFKIVGLEKLDNIGKESLINGALLKLKKKAISNDKNLRKDLTRIFGNEAEQTIEDLKNGNNSVNVKYLLFSKLSDFQPISISEMPEYYAKGGNLRIFYMLKSYTVKQIDVFHNEIFSMMDKNPKKAFNNLLRLTLALGVMNASADTIKDMLLGRKTQLSDVVVNNILRFIGFSKYTLYRARKEGLLTALYSTILPPVPFIDDMLKDLQSKTKKIKDYKIWNAIPFVGKFYYFWFGGGKETPKNGIKK